MPVLGHTPEPSARPRIHSLEFLDLLCVYLGREVSNAHKRSES
jgi:hypothetical protein